MWKVQNMMKCNNNCKILNKVTRSSEESKMLTNKLQKSNVEDVTKISNQ